MNVADSAELASVCEAAGYSRVETEAKADLILINTCVVRQHAEDRAAGFIRSLSGLKQKNPNLKIVLCGCLVTEPGRNVKKQFPHVDWFIPPNGAEELKKLLQPLTPFSPSPLVRGKGIGDRGEVVIMHGCDNFCSYCIVPYVRGREVSRPIDEVLAEVRALLEQGVTNITLLGQNVNSYKYGLANLLRNISSLISGYHDNLVPRFPDTRISFLTSHPHDMSDELIETVAELPYVAKEFVMPLQSGDDEILQKMNRGYTLHYYKGRVAKIRSLMPKARIVTDIMVGFPGETEEQFQNTLRAVEEIRFSEVHMFAYSDRPATAAERMEGKLPEEVKQKRLQRLIEVVREVVRGVQ